VVVEFRVLGPVEVRVAGRPAGAGHSRQRAVLAVLLLELGRAVPAETLIDRVWGEHPPASVRNVLYGYVGKLRAVIGAIGDPDVKLVRRPGGYQLEAGGDRLDLHRFRGLVAAAGAGDGQRAEALLREALSLWRGAALAGLDSPWLERAAAILELERTAAVLDLNDVRLQHGQHAALVSELAGLAAAAPGEERLIGQLMLALYRADRQAEALRWFEQTRQYLASELGVDPGPNLQALHQQILHADPSLAIAANPASRQQPGPPQPPAGVRQFAGRAGGLAVLSESMAQQPGGSDAGGAAHGPAGSGMPPPVGPGGPADAVALAGGGWVVPRQLPAAVPAFAGRHAELAVLSRVLDMRGGTAVVTMIGGTAGVGKTALAVQWAHQAAAQFPDGQLFINLRGFAPVAPPVTVGEAVRQFLDALQVPAERIPASVEAQLGLYRSLLSGKRLLVVLDNARDAAQVRPLLPGSPTCRTIVTSRNRLTGLSVTDAAQPLALDALSGSEARQLLAQRLGADRIAADPGAVTRIIAACARLPLALCVIAARAAMQPKLSLADAAANLAARPGLEAFTDLDDPATDIRAVFSWSYQQLDVSTGRFFRLLGLHPGPDFDRYAAATLTGTAPDQARRCLDALARAHMITLLRPDRYGVHDLLRSYARELAEGDGANGDDGQAHVSRLCDYYAYCAAAAADALYPAERHRYPHVDPPSAHVPELAEPSRARAWLDADRANLAAAAVYAAGHDLPRYPRLLSSATHRYLEAGGHAAEQSAIYTALLRSAERAGDPAAQAAGLIGLGSIELVQGRFDQAAHSYRQALALLDEVDDRYDRAHALGNLGLAESKQGRAAEAAAHLSEALLLLRQFGDQPGEARVLRHLGAICVAEGRIEQASAHFKQSLALCRRIGDALGEAEALERLGVMNHRQGRPQAGVDHLHQALDLHRQAGFLPGQCDVLRSLGTALADQQHWQHAADCYREALTLARAIGNHTAEADVLRRLTLGG
jgi:DNA-binding SARP family transcriptional activator/tetratricopeptide (TPR) repeat protein